MKAFGGKAVLEGSADVSLASLLRPVELLAVRYLEMERPWLKADQATVQVRNLGGVVWGSFLL